MLLDIISCLPHLSPLSFPLLTTGISPVGLFAPLKRRVPPTDVSSHHFLYLLPPPLASLFLRRVMEWLRHVDLSEYAPNLRGSGVHGALLVMEKRSTACPTFCFFLSCGCTCVAPTFVLSRFTAELLASLLSIPGSKSLLRYQLSYPESMSNTFTFQTAHISTLQRPAGPGYDPGEATRRVGAKLPASHPHLQGQAAQARPVHVEKEEIQGGVGFRGHGVSSCQPSAAAVGR